MKIKPFYYNFLKNYMLHGVSPKQIQHQLQMAYGLTENFELPSLGVRLKN